MSSSEKFEEPNRFREPEEYEEQLSVRTVFLRRHDVAYDDEYVIEIVDDGFINFVDFDEPNEIVETDLGIPEWFYRTDLFRTIVKSFIFEKESTPRTCNICRMSKLFFASANVMCMEYSQYFDDYGFGKYYRPICSRTCLERARKRNWKNAFSEFNKQRLYFNFENDPFGPMLKNLETDKNEQKLKHFFNDDQIRKIVERRYESTIKNQEKEKQKKYSYWWLRNPSGYAIPKWMGQDDGPDEVYEAVAKMFEE
jgi:hypothetical protein